MSRYKDFSAEDFALDKDFQKWVLNPDSETIRFWRQIIDRFPEKKEAIDEAIELVRSSGLSPDQEANAAYLQVWENVIRNADKERLHTKSRLPLYASVAAAAVAITITLTYVLRPAREQTLEYRTAYAEIKEIKLADGSTVSLNANSSLRLDDSGTKNVRKVFLKGEAFFNVVRTADERRFQVEVPGGLTIDVLGTEFHVNTRRTSPSVYLQSGKVLLQNAGESVTLQPGQRAEYQEALEKIVVTAEDADDANDRLAWRNNLYVMNDFPLSTIARDIEDNFGKKVIIADSALNTKSVTAKVPARDINVWLHVLSETLDLEIEQRDNEILVNQRK